MEAVSEETVPEAAVLKGAVPWMTVLEETAFTEAVPGRAVSQKPVV